MTQYISNGVYGFYIEVETGELYATQRGIHKLLGGKLNFWNLKSLSEIVEKEQKSANISTSGGLQTARLYKHSVVMHILQYYAFKGNITAQESLNKMYHGTALPDERVINKRKSRASSGECYLIWYKELEVYKIGYSHSAPKRFSQLQATYPRTLFLIGSCYCQNPYHLEQQLHKQYKSKRERGEFFSLSDDDVQDVLAVFEKSSRPKPR